MEKKEPSYNVGGDVIGIATMKDSTEVSQKLKIELSYDPAIPLLGVYLEKGLI